MRGIFLSVLSAFLVCLKGLYQGDLLAFCLCLNYDFTEYLCSQTKCFWNTRRETSREFSQGVQTVISFSMILQDTGTELEAFGCNPFPPWPSVAKNTY